jgi:hypothetical protein
MKISRKLLFSTARNVKSFQTFKFLWKLSEIMHETAESFQKLLIAKDDKGYNVIQLVVMYNKLENIQWSWKRMQRDIFYEKEFRAFIKLKAKDGKNILQVAATFCKNPKLHEWLWDTIAGILGKDEFKDMVENGDSDDRNVKN